MRITRLKLENFKCFESLDLEFDDGITVIYGVNGSGKSSILQAIYFAFYGADALSGRLNSIITKGQTDLSVELWFTHGGDEYHLKRELRDRDSSTYHDATIEGAGIVRDGASDVDSFIEGLFRMDADAFTNCSYVRQSDATKLIEASPSEREDMIDDLLQIGILETYREYVHNATLGAKNALEAKEEVVSNLKNQLGDHEGEEYQEELHRVQDDLEDISSRLEELEADREEEKDAISDIDSELEDLHEQEEELEEIRGKIEEAESKLDDVNGRVSGLEDTISGLERQQENLESAIGTKMADTDTLPFDTEEPVIVDGETGEDRYDESPVESVKDGLESDLDDYREQKSEAARKRDKLRGEAKRLRDKADSKEDNIDGFREQIEEKKGQIERLETQVTALEEKIENAEEDISDLQEKFDGTEYNPDSVEEEYESVTSRLGDVKEQMGELAGKQSAKKQEVKDAEELVEQGRCPECGQEIEDESHLDINEMRQELGQIQGELGKLQTQKDELEEKESLLSELVDAADQMSDLRDDISRWEDDIDEKQVERGRHENRASDLKENISDLEEDAEEFREKADEKDEEADEYDERVSTLEEKIGSVTNDIEAVDDVLSKIDGVQSIASRLESKKSELEQAEELVDERESRLQELEKERDEIQETINTSRIRNLQHERAKHERELADLNSEINRLSTERDRLKGREGELKNAVKEVQSLRQQLEEAKYKVQQLESFAEEMKDVESMYSDLRHSLREKNVKRLRQLLNELFTDLYQNDSYQKVELTNDYELTIYEKGGETIPPEQLSGGEKAMFNLSLRCAIYKLLTEGMEGEAPLPPLFLDEPTANLDKGHVEQIPKIVNMVRDLGIDQTFVVSHNEEVVSSADDKIHVHTKDTSNRSVAEKDVADPLGL